MITQASGLWMGVARFSILLRGVGVLAMPDAGLDTTQGVQSVRGVAPGAGVPGVAVVQFVDNRSVPDGV
jgi:hypothetical protein